MVRRDLDGNELSTDTGTVFMDNRGNIRLDMADITAASEKGSKQQCATCRNSNPLVPALSCDNFYVHRSAGRPLFLHNAVWQEDAQQWVYYTANNAPVHVFEVFPMPIRSSHVESTWGWELETLCKAAGVWEAHKADLLHGYGKLNHAASNMWPHLFDCPEAAPPAMEPFMRAEEPSWQPPPMLPLVPPRPSHCDEEKEDSDVDIMMEGGIAPPDISAEEAFMLMCREDAQDQAGVAVAKFAASELFAVAGACPL